MNTLKTVGILNYGAGNFGSVKRAVESLGVSPIEVKEPVELQFVERLIFPGVGSAQQAMSELKKRGFVEPLREFARSGKPLLGICVGMQVLGDWSEEGNTTCLGLLPFKVEKFNCKEPIPHMGWNSISWNQNHPNFSAASSQLAGDANFYFVHSYAAFIDETENCPQHILGSTDYGPKRFCALVSQGSIWGAQCHIEKSGRVGLQLIENFLCWERS